MAKKTEGAPTVLTCGLIMPISTIDGCPAEHWMDVKNIITEAVSSIDEPKFSTKLVSDQDDVGVIQKRIVQNIYDSDIVVCDVSCKNSNVMFELGMRLAFDKPTILIKDDQTDFSFDTGVIEHLIYPRDLRFSRIVSFKAALADKISATYRAATGDSSYSTFLKHFGSFKIAGIDQSVVTADQAILTTIQDLSRDVSLINKRLLNFDPNLFSQRPPPPPPLFFVKMDLTGSRESYQNFLAYIKSAARTLSVKEVAVSEGGVDYSIEIVNTSRINAKFFMEAASSNGLEVRRCS
ncbi:hypothetical protein [Pseudomonas poae]|uniref:hypothetical protein n=1 Tax=Pseudomonas poae TaxID=200451 RepID=UPI0034D662ED